MHIAIIMTTGWTASRNRAVFSFREELHEVFCAALAVAFLGLRLVKPGGLGLRLPGLVN
jgi:hypothetical protein